METVRCRDLDPDNIYVTGHVKPNNCFWKEYPDSKKRFALCIRVYALFGQGMEGYESIGMYTHVYPDTKYNNPDYISRHQVYECMYDSKKHKLLSVYVCMPCLVRVWRDMRV